MLHGLDFCDQYLIDDLDTAPQKARRREEQEYVEHPDAADKGFTLGLQFLRDRGVIGGSKVCIAVVVCARLA